MSDDVDDHICPICKFDLLDYFPPFERGDTCYVCQRHVCCFSTGCIHCSKRNREKLSTLISEHILPDLANIVINYEGCRIALVKVIHQPNENACVMSPNEFVLCKSRSIHCQIYQRSICNECFKGDQRVKELGFGYILGHPRSNAKSNKT